MHPHIHPSLIIHPSSIQETHTYVIHPSILHSIPLSICTYTHLSSFIHPLSHPSIHLFSNVHSYIHSHIPILPISHPYIPPTSMCSPSFYPSLLAIFLSIAQIVILNLSFIKHWVFILPSFIYHVMTQLLLRLFHLASSLRRMLHPACVSLFWCRGLHPFLNPLNPLASWLCPEEHSAGDWSLGVQRGRTFLFHPASILLGSSSCWHWPFGLRW